MACCKGLERAGWGAASVVGLLFGVAAILLGVSAIIGAKGYAESVRARP